LARPNTSTKLAGKDGWYPWYPELQALAARGFAGTIAYNSKGSVHTLLLTAFVPARSARPRKPKPECRYRA
jgi:hypothetical protein